ncbi:hypothetical protein [Kamptonema formosum]|uniref:hypothetical protein n=1 Tax=Kamptonema formosum TaxID=331992 RepID=UPI00035DBC1A|nr:hypothetical protein [Oscillatoria sp. PCC 10802]
MLTETGFLGSLQPKTATSAKILGKWLRMAIPIAPMAFPCLAHPDGEVGIASAGAGAGGGLEEVAAVRKQTPQ